MHDFDIVRSERENVERVFKIGGEEFTFKPYMSADLAAAYFDSGTIEESGTSDILKAADALILSVLENGGPERWAKVRAVDAPWPLSVSDVQDVAAYLVRVTSGRPTVSPSSSSISRSTAGTSLTGADSSQEGQDSKD